MTENKGPYDGRLDEKGHSPLFPWRYGSKIRNNHRGGSERNPEPYGDVNNGFLALAKRHLVDTDDTEGAMISIDCARDRERRLSFKDGAAILFANAVAIYPTDQDNGLGILIGMKLHEYPSIDTGFPYLDVHLRPTDAEVKYTGKLNPDNISMSYRSIVQETVLLDSESGGRSGSVMNDRHVNHHLSDLLTKVGNAVMLPNTDVIGASVPPSIA